MKKFLLSSLAAVSMMTTLTVTPQLQQTQLNVSAADYTVQYMDPAAIGLSMSGSTLSFTLTSAKMTQLYSDWSYETDQNDAIIIDMYSSYSLTTGHKGWYELVGTAFGDPGAYLGPINAGNASDRIGGGLTSVNLSAAFTQYALSTTGEYGFAVYYFTSAETYIELGRVWNRETPSYLDEWVGIVNSGEANRIVSYATKPTRAAILADLRAYDLEDGDVTLSITETTAAAEKTAYDSLSRGLATYNLTFQATDSSSNMANVTVHVTVTDPVAPVISGPESISTPLSTDVPLATLISQNWSASDAFAGARTLSVVTDNYTANMNVVNSTTGHSVTIRATDPSGNITNKTVYIKVLDDVKPTITGTASYSKGMSATLAVSTIQAALTANGTGTSATIAISYDNYTPNANKAGAWQVQFRATDAAGNVSDPFTVTVTVSDTQAPIFFIDGSKYTVDPGDVYTIAQLVAVLESDGTIDNTQDYSWEVIVDEYSDQATISGSHKVVLNIKYASGATQQVEMNIDVPEQLPVENDLPWWESAWNEFVDWVEGIISSIFGG